MTGRLESQEMREMDLRKCRKSMCILFLSVAYVVIQGRLQKKFCLVKLKQKYR